MSLFKQKYRIETTRLKSWDYASAGWYFVTICTKYRGCWLGEISDGDIHLSAIGEAAYQCWLEIPHHFPHIQLDEFVVMPNHTHGIVIIEDNHHGDVAYDVGRDVACNVSTTGSISRMMSNISPKSGSLSAIIRSYKSAVTRLAGVNGHSEFGWQPRFYDHIIRDENSLHNLRRYIVNNPAKWDEDKFNPKRPSPPSLS